MTKRNWLTFNTGGFFVPALEIGAKTEKGTKVGHVLSIYGEKIEEVMTAVPSIVIGIRHDPVAHTGERAGFVATEWDEVPLS